MFAKLKGRLPQDLDVSRLKGSLQGSYGSKKSPIKLSYYHVNDHRYFSQIFPAVCKIKPDGVAYAELVGGAHLTPHKDHGITCAINYYIETNRATTYFYNDIGEPYNYPGEQTANLYRFEDIEVVSFFEAQQYDIYLLDVAKVHSVLNPPGTRKFISWQWVSKSYEEIYHNLILEEDNVTI